MVIQKLPFDQICRTCKRTSSKLRSLFCVKGSKSRTTKKRLVEILEECVSIEVKEGDGMPESMCLKCVRALNQVHHFRLKCQRTQSELIKYRDNGLNHIQVVTQRTKKASSSTTNVKYKQEIDFPQLKEELALNIFEDTAKNDLIKHSSEHWKNSIDIQLNNSVAYPLKNVDSKEEITSFVENDHITDDADYLSKIKPDCFGDTLDETALIETNDRLVRNSMRFKNRKPNLLRSIVPKKARQKNKLKFRNEVADTTQQARKQQCGICGKFLSYQTKMAIHMRKHTGERPFSCDVCGKSFARAEHVVRHKLIHTGEKPYSCKICEKRFVQRAALTCHLRTHTDERPHVCSVCGKSFRQTITLQRHMRTHTGEKPFKCSVCDKCFTHSGNLNVHMRYHNNWRPYNCDRCTKHFFTLSHLQMHIKQHDGIKDQECNICGKRFIHRQHLKDHLVTHTGDKPHHCSICPKSYTQKSHLNHHMKTSHHVQRMPTASEIRVPAELEETGSC